MGKHTSTPEKKTCINDKLSVQESRKLWKSLIVLIETALILLRMIKINTEFVKIGSSYLMLCRWKRKG